jgi:hypothetical protein
VKALSILLAVIVSLLCSYAPGASSASVAPRQIYNGDFEIPAKVNKSIPAGYTGGGLGSMARVASGTDGVPAYSGSWLVRLTVPSGYVAAQVLNPAPFAAPAPGAYTLRVALRSGGVQARAIVGYAFLDANRRPVSGADILTVQPPAGSWTVYAPSVSVPVGASYVVVGVRNSLHPSPPAASHLYVDALDLVPAAPTTKP